MGARKLYELNGEMLSVKQLYAKKTVMMHINLLYERLRSGMAPAEAISTVPESVKTTAARVRRITHFNKQKV